MNKSMVTGIVVGAVVATAGGAMAGYGLLSGDRPPTHAEVIDVRELTETVRTPREECSEVPVTRQQPVKDEHRVTGTVTGAIIGGVLGNQVGGGSGKKLATVAGAAAGGYAGNKTQEQMQANNTYTTYETRCRTIQETSEVHRGYEVTYRLGEQVDTLRMDHHPGSRISLKNGEPVTAEGN